MVPPLSKTDRQFLKMLNMELPCDPAIPLLGRQPRELGIYIPVKTCRGMFTMMLFTIAKEWRQPKCPSTNEWINKMWCILTAEYSFSHKKEWGTDACYNTMNLENVIVSGRNQAQKAIYYRISFMWDIQNRQIYRDRKQNSGWHGLGGRWGEEWGVTANEYGEQFFLRCWKCFGIR